MDSNPFNFCELTPAETAERIIRIAIEGGAENVVLPLRLACAVQPLTGPHRFSPGEDKDFCWKCGLYFTNDCHERIANPTNKA